MSYLMRVRVELTLEIDPRAWLAVYDGGDLSQVRRDVKDYARHCLANSGAAKERALLAVTESA